MDGEWRTEVVAIKDLTGAPARVAAALVDRGFDLRGRPREVCDLLNAMDPEAVGLAVDATGWVGSGGDTFVCLSGRILTHKGGTQGILFSGRARLVGEPQGSAESWKENVLKTATAPHDAGIFGLCTAIAPTLLPIFGHAPELGLPRLCCAADPMPAA